MRDAVQQALLRDVQGNGMRAVYRAHQDSMIGPDPFVEASHDWPEQVTNGGRLRLKRSKALRGWRCWNVALLPDGSPRLVAPFITSIYGEALTTPGMVWKPGTNRSSPVGCQSKPDFDHPTRWCRCGLRAVRSLTVLRAFARNQEPRIGPLVALAEVDVWGRVASYAPDDDWQHTVRAEYAEIVGPLYVADGHPHSPALAAHYRVPLAPLSSRAA